MCYRKILVLLHFNPFLENLYLLFKTINIAGAGNTFTELKDKYNFFFQHNIDMQNEYFCMYIILFEKSAAF